MRPVAVLAFLAALLATDPARAGLPRLPLGTAPQCLASPFVPDPTGTLSSPDTEGWGPTDVNAQTANGRLAVGLNRAGTVTVFKWPTPSYSDQIKYFTHDRRAARMGALINEGAFLGLVVDGRTVWLRDLPRRRQRFATPRSDEVVTTYARRGLRITVRDVVAPQADALLRAVAIRVARRAPRPTALVAYENLNLVDRKLPAAPGLDFCDESVNVDSASWDARARAIVHTRGAVAVAMGVDGRPSGFQVGGDSQADPAGATVAQDAYEDAADGRLSGASSFTGQTTGAIARPLRFRRGRASALVTFAAGTGAPAARSALDRARRLGERRAAWAKLRRLAGELRRAPLPRTRDPRILALARRALILLVTTQGPGGSIPAAISTQPPYGEDWPRDGSFFDWALDRAGLTGRVDRHAAFYLRTQATLTSQPRGSLGIPPGNWAMNYYDDGEVGGPIPWEIDETGFAIWTLTRHAGSDAAKLRRVYPAVKRAADFLAVCRDLINRLQCRATEDDNFQLYQQQTVAGAATTWMGLDRAAAAAAQLGYAADAARWRARRDELGRAIDDSLWNAAGRNYGGGGEYGAYLLWPARVAVRDPARLAAQAEYLWQQIEPTFRAPRSGRTFGLYEAKDLIALARWYRANDPPKLARVRAGLRWIAHVEATPDTGLLGETWRVFNGRVIPTIAVPQLWEHTLFYIAALQTYGERRSGW